MCVTVHVTERGACLCGCWRLLRSACGGIKGLGFGAATLLPSIPLFLYPLCLSLSLSSSVFIMELRRVGVVRPALLQVCVTVFALKGG